MVAEDASPDDAAVPALPTATHRVIEDHAEYLAAVERIRAGEGPTAIDAERASGFRYSQRAYLIQVFRRGAGSFLFDPPAIGGDLHELGDAIGDGEWIIHAASQDLTCLREVGIHPKTLFDTELGARLLGMDRVGLGPVVEELLGIHLAKAHSAVDWSIRPLRSEWLEYAALDVELLVDVRDRLADRLAEAGKAEFAAEEFAATLTRDFNPPRTDPWRKMSDLHTVRGQRGLAVARELWLARDAWAQETDIAPGRLVPDRALAAAARAMPATKRELADLKDFNGRASRSQLDRWWAAIERGRTTEDLPPMRIPGDTLPPIRAWADRNPAAAERIGPAREAIGELAEELSIPLENLLTPDHLRRIAWSPPDPATPEAIGEALKALGARPWQVALTAQRIADSFSAA